ncbi:unnamed protein product [Urochloa decumbens]|uniref:Uncharacterized protein n=1 Tax=Urochloa decumbens TaxID=240449 RepID=A0ABC8W8W6_9POAL
MRRWSYYYRRRRLKLKACSTVLLVLLLLLVVAADAKPRPQRHQHQNQMGLLPNCTTSCGGVSVPYPFGIERGCYLHGFRLTCNTSYRTPRLHLWLGTVLYVITSISLDPSTMRFRPSQLIMEPSLAPVPRGPGPSKSINGTEPPGCHLFSKQARLDWEVGSTALQLQGRRRQHGPKTCPRDLGGKACHSSHSSCWATSGPYTRSSNHTPTGYVCGCHDGYQGNPYLARGCQDIDECSDPAKCFGHNCTNLPGKYLCHCPKGTTGDPYIQNGCVEPHPNTGLIIGLGVGIGAMLPFLVIGTTFIIRKIKAQRKKKMRRRFFKQNRGQLLQQLVCQSGNIAERMIVVTLEELEKATNNFDTTRELGGGAHGTVYKGILSSLHVVAIKKSKIVIQREIDDFINEVAILSQINHRNIVKLHGCCLETEVPLLVYEFISNGTLYDHLHVDGLISLPWKDRLRIAVEAARALAYLHSLASMPIIHRDVKSPNILLDSNLTVKLSDFGASRYIPIDQSGVDTLVQGTFGYLDPMYYSTGRLTDKSDVYSFGVILIELLTRKKPVSYRSPKDDGLVNHFSTLVSEGNLVQILDPQVIKEGGGEVTDIALLAKICVKFVSKDRPTMRQVEMTLESIHAAKEYTSSDDVTDESEEYYVQANGLSVGGKSVDATTCQDMID